MKRLQLTLIILILAPVMVLGENNGSSSGVLNFTAADKKFLEIRTPDNLACSIDLVAAPQKNVDAKYEILADVRSDEVKDRYFKLIEVSMDDNTQTAGGLRLRVLTPTEAPWEGKDSHIRLNIHINVPYNFKIDSKNSYSDLKLNGPLNGVTINNEYGTVSVVDIKGATTIKTPYSGISLDKIQGDIDIQTSYSSILARNIVIDNNIGIFETSYGSITLENIRGPLEASTSYGLINASDLEAPDGSIVLRTSYGKIEAEKISGEIICETSYSPVDLSEINFTHGMNSVETRYSPINIEMFKINDAQLIINNTYNNINLSLPRDISARLTLAVDKGGKIHTLGIPIKPLVMEKTRLEGLVGDGRSQVELNVDGIGEINIETR